MTDRDGESGDAKLWRADVDALTFRPRGHGGVCMVHRRALRTLLKGLPAPDDCAAFFREHEAAFQLAAHAKIVRENLATEVSLHLTSRDVARAIAQLAVATTDQSG